MEMIWPKNNHTRAHIDVQTSRVWLLINLGGDEVKKII